MKADLFLRPMNPLCSAITVYYMQNKYVDILYLKYIPMLSHLKISVHRNSIPFPTAKLMPSSQTSLQ